MLHQLTCNNNGFKDVEEAGSRGLEKEAIRSEKKKNHGFFLWWG